MKPLKFLALLLTTLPAFAAQEALTWTANDPADGVTSYQVWASTNMAGPFTQISTVLTNAASGQPIVPGVRNYYYVVSVNACCMSDPGITAFRPAQVVNIKVVGASGNERLSWDASPASDLVTLYQVWGSTAATGPWNLITTTANNSVQGGSAGQRTYYYVIAMNQFGASDQSAVVVKPGQPKNEKVNTQ